MHGAVEAVKKLSKEERAQINLVGHALEQQGRIEEAIAVYEGGIAANTDTPLTYKRLRVLYRRLKRTDDVNRIQEAHKAQFGHYIEAAPPLGLRR